MAKLKNTRYARIDYKKVVADLNHLITAKVDSLRDNYRVQVLKNNWRAGKYLKDHLPLQDLPSKDNAVVLTRLAESTRRSRRFYYALIKFYKYYPECPDSPFLGWSHYEALTRIADSALRRQYEKLACQQTLSAKDLSLVIFNDRRKAFKPKTSGLAGRLGRLYTYRVMAPTLPPEQQPRVRSGGIPAGRDGPLSRAFVDLGFHFFKELPVPAASRLHVGHTVRSVRVEGGDQYVLKLNAVDKEDLYTYQAEVERVIDGDTLVALLDCGFGVRTRQKLRLRGIDAPELTSLAGQSALRFVKDVLPKGGEALVKTYKDDKYGRMLADVFFAGAAEKNGPPEFKYLNKMLLDKNLAKRYR